VEAVLTSSRIQPLDIEVIWLRAGRTVSDTARRLIDIGGSLGAQNVLIVSSNPDHDDAKFQFAQLCELAAAAGMRAVLEFLMIGEVSTLAQALEIVRSVDHPAGGVLIDALHLARSNGTPADVRSVDRALLPYAQLCDAPASLRAHDHAAYLADALDGRCCPGEGELRLHALVDALPAGTPFSLEIRSSALRGRFGDPVDRARAVLDATRRFLDAPRDNG
jgi:sugar phosphate isomerase/epimerase